jgi:hypothetical protein
LKTIFDLCEPRKDVVKGDIAKSDFAADLAQVIKGTASDEYRTPEPFFRNTYPTRGLKSLLANVCARLSGKAGEVAAIFRLGTSFGGGKTHSLIALVHAANGMRGVTNAGEFIDPDLVPKNRVRVAAFDGENADPANGRKMGDDILAFTPWGEIAYALAGKAGYERVRRGDEQAIAPGAETIQELFGGEATLILLDELSVYLRKVQKLPQAREQLAAFLTSLFKAVESSPKAAVVYTLSIGKDDRSSDAYSEESQFIADRMAEIESVSARKATLLNPTEDDETVQVLRRRLFDRIDDHRASEVIDSYHEIWNSNRDALVGDAARPETIDAFRSSYPFHPDVLATLTGKTATLVTFQRVRGMLRLLAGTVTYLWRTKPADATAIHLHHIDPGFAPIYEEIATRLGQRAYVPAIRNDIVAAEPGKKALAQEIDDAHYRGLAPYATYVARTIFIHTLAYNDQLKGVTPEHLRYSILGPETDISFIDDARKRFAEDSSYLDDRPTAPLRFLVEANLTQIIRRQELHADAGQVRAELNDRIKRIFGGNYFEMIPFAGGPWEVPDDTGDGRPRLVVMSYDGVTAGTAVESVPDLVAQIFARKNAEGSAFRELRNNLLFAVADDDKVAEMRRAMVRRLALAELRKPERLGDLAEHQKAKILELEERSESQVAVAVQQCYQHVFYPSRNRLPRADVDLAHTALALHNTSDSPGAGQVQILRTLREQKKLRTRDDEPDAPAYIRDRTPLRKGQMTTAALRDEFRKDPALPILLGEEVFVRAIRKGVEDSVYVYRSGTLLYGPGDPNAVILVDENSVVFTMDYARQHNIWPRPKPETGTGAGGGGASDGSSGGGGTGAGGDTHGGGGGGTDTGGAGGGTATSSQTFTVEAVLREALIQLWEQARKAKVDRIGVLKIKVFDTNDAFRLLGAVSSIPSAAKTARIKADYETKDGAMMELTFSGPVADALPVKDFLDSQMRAAADKKLDTTFEIRFNDGLTMGGDAAEKLTDRLSKFATGSAYVSASAEAKA